MRSLFMKESSSSEFEQYTRTTAGNKELEKKVQVHGFLAANDLHFISSYLLSVIAGDS
jgi:hypothetical protein